MHCFWPCLTLAGNLFCCGVFVFVLFVFFLELRGAGHWLFMGRSLFAGTSLIVFTGNGVDGGHHRSALRIFCAAPTKSRSLHRFATFFISPQGWGPIYTIQYRERGASWIFRYGITFCVHFSAVLVSFIKSPSSIKFVDMVLSVSALLIFRDFFHHDTRLLCLIKN